MTQVELYVSGQVCDLGGPDLPLSLNLSISDLTDLTSRGGGFSRSFNLPATRNNSRILGGLWEMGRIDAAAVAARAELPAEIFVDGIPILTGILSVQGVTGRNEAATYKVQLLADNVDWLAAIRSKEIRELDFGDEIWSSANEQATWGNTKPHVYPFVNYGEWSQISRVRMPADLRPWLSVRETVLKIFAAQGYSVVSTFLDSAEGKRFIWHGGGSHTHGDKFLDRYTFWAETGADQASTGVPPAFFNKKAYCNFNVVNYNGGGFQNVPNVGAFSWPPYPAGPPPAIGQKSVLYQLGSHGTRMKVYVELNIIIEFPNPPAMPGSPMGFIYLFDQLADPAMGFWDAQEIWDVVAAGTYTFKYEVGPFEVDFFTFQNQFTVAAACPFDDFILKAGSYIRVRHVPEVQPYQRYSIVDSATQPGQLQADFLQGITHAFNLMWRTDAAGKKVYVEPRTTYLNSGVQNAATFDQRVDLEKDIEIAMNESAGKVQELQFSSDGSDAYVTELESRAGEKLYAVRYLFDQGGAMMKKESSENPFFCPTHHLADDNVKRAAANNPTPFPPILPRIWNDVWSGTGPYPEKISGFSPRILYYDGYTGGGQRGIRYETEDAMGGLILSEDSAWPKAFAVDIISPGSGKPCLSYADVNLNGTIVRGLAYKYYLRQLTTKRRGVRLQAYFMLKKTEISQNLFQKPIIFKGEMFELVEVQDFKPLEKDSTKLNLLQIVDPTTGDEGSFIHSGINPLDNLK